MATAPNLLANSVETFAAPIEDLITALGIGVAQAQQGLDQNSIQTQESIDTNPLLSQYGLQATWYQFPSVTMQLKMSLSISQDPAPASASPSQAVMIAAPVRLHIIAQPLSASFQTQFNYDATAATQINVTLVPVPPPNSGTQVPPLMTNAKVQAAALASAAPFITTKDSGGNTIPATVDGQGDALSLIINFNATARVWYVIQYAPSNATVPGRFRCGR